MDNSMIKVFPKTAEITRIPIDFSLSPVEREKQFWDYYNKNNCVDYNEFFIPFWDIHEKLRFLPECPDHTRYNDYCRHAIKYINLTDNVEECDFIVYPYEWKGLNLSFAKYYNIAKLNNKKMFVLYNDDSVEPLNLDPNVVIVLRTSIDSRKNPSNEYSYPGWNIDYKFYDIPLIEKYDKPTVSFHGYAGGVAIRNYAIQLLQNCNNLNTDISLKSAFVGHLPLTERIKNRNTYVQSLINSHYVLTPRGNGNFSYRFFEVLSSRRIPVFFDTNCKLPLQHKIDWDKYIVNITKNNVDQIENVILAHYNNFNGEEFLMLQQNIRDLYDKWLSPLPFFTKLKENFL